MIVVLDASVILKWLLEDPAREPDTEKAFADVYKRQIIATFAAIALVISPVAGQTPARIRGTITAINVGRITVKERGGRSVTLKSGSYTTYSNVVPSSLDAIKVNDFVGSATPRPYIRLT